MREAKYKNFNYEIIYTNNNIKNDYALSIVIPCHNSAGKIRPMLLSLELQRFNWNVQLIFVLDNCEDNTEEVIKANLTNPNYTVSILKTNVGYAGVAREIGRCEVKGKYFWSIDSDDYLLRPDAIQTVCDIFKDFDFPEILHVKYCSDSDGWWEKHFHERPNYYRTFWANIYRNDLIKNVHCNVKFIDDDYEFYDEFMAQTGLLGKQILETNDYFYYYCQLSNDGISAKYWLEMTSRDELVGALPSYYEEMKAAGRLLK